MNETIKQAGDELLSEFSDRLNSKLEELSTSIVQPCMENGSSHEFLKTAKQIQERSRGSKNKESLDKTFLSRPSILTELLEISHIRTIYHIFIAIMIIFILNTFGTDYVDKGRINLQFDLITWSFGKLSLVMSLWVAMLSATLLILYPLAHYWAHNRRAGAIARLEGVWLGGYVVFQCVFLCWPIHVLQSNQLPPASCFIIACEQTRLMMKVHAFIRSSIPRVLKFKKDEKPDFPDFSKYLYFLFAPTLVYCDQYPRNKSISWKYVISNFAQVFASLVFMHYIMSQFCIPVFRDFSRRDLTAKALLLGMFGSMLPGTLCLFIGFFAILHSWLNAFAEMLRFADRLFYKDWWNASSFSIYYRTWNIVVHDWLYTYVYKDLHYLGLRNRAASMATVFLFSALFHEYILSVSFGFVYPVLFFMFAGAGFAFIFVPTSNDPRSGNIFMWVSLFMGTGILMCLYSMEWYARRNCPRSTENTMLDSFVPRSWTCSVG